MDSESASNEIVRVPCVDDMCTGVLDARGVCGTCGKVGDASLIEKVANEDASGVDAAEAEALRAGEADTELSAESSASDEDVIPGEHDVDARVLCIDDMCTGIIGTDGACGTCGKRIPRAD